MTSWEECAATWKARYPTSEQQAEYFLLRFKVDGDVSSAAVYKLLAQFQSFDTKKTGELEEDEAMRMLEARGEAKTFKELRTMVSEIDLDKNRKLCFLEWCCAVFKKSWKDLHTPSGDPNEVGKLSALAGEFSKWKLNAEAEANKLQLEEVEKKQKAEDAARKLEGLSAKEKETLEQLQKKKAEEDAVKAAEEQKKKEALGQKGIKGMAAKFADKADSTKDETASRAEQIKKDAAERKLKQDLENQKKRAEEDSRKAEEDAQRVAQEKDRALKEAAEAKAKADAVEAEREKADRARREKEAYEAEKQKQEADAAAAEAEKAKKAAESKAKLAAKAALFSK